MARFEMVVSVEQLVSKTIKLELDALDYEDAVIKAKDAVQTFPREVLQDGIHRMLAIRQEFNPPETFEVLDCRELKKHA